MLSDIENLDIMLGGNNFEREEGESGNSGRRPGSSCYVASMNQKTNSPFNSHEADNCYKPHQV